MRAMAIALLAGGAIFGSACLARGDRAATVPTQTTTTVTAAQPTATTTGGAPIRREELLRALLAVDDMPTGWTTSPSGPNIESQGNNICGQPLDTQRRVEQVSVGFQRSQSGPFLLQTVGVYERGGAAAFMESLKRASESCTTWTVTGREGKITVWKLAPLSFPKLGDETFAFRLSIDTGVLPGESDVVFVRRGDIVSLLEYAGVSLATVDSQQTETIVRKADEKLQKVAR